MSNVKAIKLITGEEIVADVINETESTIDMKNPLLVAVQPTERGDMAIRFAPFAAYAENHTVTVERNKLVFVINVDQGLRDQYNVIFGAGIVTPAPKKILLS